MITEYIINAIALSIFIILVIFAVFPSTLVRIIGYILPGDFGVDHSFSSAADEDRINEQIVTQKAILDGIFRG